MAKQKTLAKNAILNSIKTIMSMVFPLITFPYVSRILQVENMGKVNFAASIASYFTLLAGLGIKTYAIREGARLRDNREVLQKFVNEVFGINLVSTIIALILYLCTVFGIGRLVDYRSLLLVYSFSIIGPTIGIEWLYAIYEDYFYITMRSILVQFISMLFLFLLVHSKEDYVIYAGISVFATTASFAFNFFHAKKYVEIRPCFGKSLKKHIKPVLIIFAMAIATTIYVNSDTTMLGFFVGDHYVGLYNAATKMYNILKNLMAACILVALPRLSNYLATQNLIAYKKQAGSIFDFFVVLLGPTVVGVFFTADEIVMLLAGETYLEAAGALRILSISLAFSIVATYMTHVVLLPFKKEKDIMFATFASAGINVLLNLFLIPRYMHLGAAFTTLIAEFIVMIWQIIVARRLPHAEINKHNLITTGVGCVIVIIVCSIVNVLNLSFVLRLILKVTFSVISYLAILILGRHTFVQLVFEKIGIKR